LTAKVSSGAYTNNHFTSKMITATEAKAVTGNEEPG
jgi:hypothetical protein